jgi:hypothetical protein
MARAMAGEDAITCGKRLPTPIYLTPNLDQNLIRAAQRHTF